MREQQIAGAAGGVGGGLTGGGGMTGGGGFTGGGGVTVSSSGGGGVKVAPAPTLIEQVSAENAAKYYGTPGENIGAAEFRMREAAADQGVFQAIPAGFDVAAARRGEEASMITINVNAPSIIDKEGFSRAMVDALNESNARLGAGGGGLRGIQQIL